MADNQVLPKHFLVLGDYLVDAELPAVGREEERDFVSEDQQWMELYQSRRSLLF